MVLFLLGGGGWDTLVGAASVGNRSTSRTLSPTHHCRHATHHAAEATKTYIEHRGKTHRGKTFATHAKKCNQLRFVKYLKGTRPRGHQLDSTSALKSRPIETAHAIPGPYIRKMGGPLALSSDLTVALVLLSFFPFCSLHGRFVCGRGRVGVFGIRCLDRIHWIRI